MTEIIANATLNNSNCIPDIKDFQKHVYIFYIFYVHKFLNEKNFFKMYS